VNVNAEKLQDCCKLSARDRRYRMPQTIAAVRAFLEANPNDPRRP
jgi:hypothetical protein